MIAKPGTPTNQPNNFIQTDLATSAKIFEKLLLGRLQVCKTKWLCEVLRSLQLGVPSRKAVEGEIKLFETSSDHDALNILDIRTFYIQKYGKNCKERKVKLNYNIYEDSLMSEKYISYT